MRYVEYSTSVSNEILVFKVKASEREIRVGRSNGQEESEERTRRTGRITGNESKSCEQSWIRNDIYPAHPKTTASERQVLQLF